MNTVTKKRVSRKPTRTVCLLAKPTPYKIGTLEITVGGESMSYWLRQIPSDFGLAYELTKHDDGEAYNVHLDVPNGATCECKGWLRWGHCKHTDGLARLRELRRLD